MPTVATWRLHVAAGISPRLDFVEFIQSVVSGLLKTISSASSCPNGRRIINNQCWSAPPSKRKNSRTLLKLQNKYCKKNVKNVLFACILCASWITICDKLCLFLVFLSLFHDIWSVSSIESAYREDRAMKFFCAMLAGDGVLDHCCCRGTKKVNVKMIASETKLRKN